MAKAKQRDLSEKEKRDIKKAVEAVNTTKDAEEKTEAVSKVKKLCAYDPQVNAVGLIEITKKGWPFRKKEPQTAAATNQGVLGRVISKLIEDNEPTLAAEALALQGKINDAQDRKEKREKDEAARSTDTGSTDK